MEMSATTLVSALETICLTVMPPPVKATRLAPVKLSPTMVTRIDLPCTPMAGLMLVINTGSC